MAYDDSLSTLVDTLLVHAKNKPRHIALICDDDQISYAELAVAAQQSANGLVANNITTGDRVAYLGKESIEFYKLLFACALTGSVLVPINWRLTEPEVGHILNDSCAKAVFFDHTSYDLIASLQAENEAVTILVTLDVDMPDIVGCGFFGHWYSQFDNNFTPISINEDTVITQLYTSGTTGLPKGVELAHRSFYKVIASLVGAGLDWIDWRAEDISFVGVPSFHVGGLWCTLQSLNAGATCILLRNFLIPLALKTIVERNVSVICMVPSMIQLLLLERDVNSHSYAHLRKIVYGGSPISESLLIKAIEQFQCDFVQIYGLTETGNTAVCLPPEAHVVGSGKLKAAGRPYPCVSLKIVDIHGNEITDGNVGEICIKSPASMLRYWQLPDATSSTLVDGWIYSGDAGYMQEGYLYICDRIKDTIIVAGENIYPSEIENVLSKCPGVQEVAVIGVPHEQWGEAIRAIVVREDTSEPVTPRALVLFAQTQLAGFKIPHFFEFSESIPRNPSGKILRRALRDQYWEEMERQVN